MKQLHSLYTWILLVMVFPVQSRAQNQFPDSGWLQISIANTASIYYDRLKGNAPFYNGVEYTGYGQNINGHPFFKTDTLQRGSLYYDGTLYHDIPLSYDLVSDEVVIKDYTNNYYIRLNSAKIRYFSVMNHVFIRQDPEKGNESIRDFGFYDRIYEGPTTVFVKRKKQINHTVTQEKTISTYVQYDNYYIQKGDGFFHVTGKNSLLSGLQDKKAELRKWLSREKLDFKKDMDNSIRKTVAYYDQIKRVG